VWLTVHKSTLEGQRNDVEDTVLLRLRELIPGEVKVTVLADRGFADQALYTLLAQLDFSYVVRQHGRGAQTRGGVGAEFGPSAHAEKSASHGGRDGGGRRGVRASLNADNILTETRPEGCG
jgi:hypothetical protein